MQCILKRILAIIILNLLLFTLAPSASAQTIAYETWIQGASGSWHIVIRDYYPSYHVATDYVNRDTGVWYFGAFNAWLPTDMMSVSIFGGNMWYGISGRIRFCWRGAGDYAVLVGYDYSQFFAWAQATLDGYWVNLVGSEDHNQFAHRYNDGACAVVSLG